MENMELWNKVKQVPKEYLKQINSGRLKGMSDINPQWRIMSLTEQFGMCGIGWKYTVINKWTEPGANGQIFAFVDIELFYKNGEQWSEPIPGHGGSMLISAEQKGAYLHCNDEAFKMAITDAISVAAKFLGFGADVYLGRWDGSKYRNNPDSMDQRLPEDRRPAQTGRGASRRQVSNHPAQSTSESGNQQQPPEEAAEDQNKKISQVEFDKLSAKLKELKVSKEKWYAYRGREFNITSTMDLTIWQYYKVMDVLSKNVAAIDPGPNF